MKLASIILPLLDNEGNDLFREHQSLKHFLLSKWGGYTSYETVGGWKGRNGMVEGEQAVRYDVAMDRADVCAFRDMAIEVCRNAHQEAVMIVTPKGDVEFVHPRADLCITQNQMA